MAITYNNTIFVYRTGDADSLALAQYYQSFRGLPNDQLIAVPCSTTEILADYATFQTEVETPISNALTTSPLASRDIFVIILGLNVPGGFYDGSDVISSVSRIMKIKSSYTKRVNNYFCIQKTSFVSGDEDYSYIVSRIDAPTLSLAKKIIDNTKILQYQQYVNGDLFLDPYFGNALTAYNIYKSNMIDFIVNKAYKLNLVVQTTKDQGDTIDTTFPYLEGDSFYWGGLANTPTSSFFGESNASRALFYNITSSASDSLRDISSKSWALIAAEKDYCASVGAMSSVTPADFLDMTSFFYTLLDGKTFGEAFLFSLPYHNWTINIIGDPLLTMSFPKSGLPWSKCSTTQCSNCSDGTPSEINLSLNDIEINSGCIFDGSSSYKLVSSDVEINGAHTLTQVERCKWTKIYSQVIRRQFFSNADCSSVPTTDELMDFIIQIEITKRFSNIYYLDIVVSDYSSSDPDLTHTYFFRSSSALPSNNCLSGFVVSNQQINYSFDQTTQDAQVGKNGTINIAQTLCGGSVSSSIFDNNSTESEIWNDTNISLAKALAHYKYKTDQYAEALNNVVMSSDISEEVALLYVVNTLYNSNDDISKISLFKASVENLIDWAKTRFINDYKIDNPLKSSLEQITLHQFLSMKRYKISQKLLDVVGISSSNSDIKAEDIYPSGYWEYIYIIDDKYFDYALYNFELDIAYDSNFSLMVQSFDTSVSQRGWYLEQYIKNNGVRQYAELPSTGAPSSYIGKRIKFSSPVLYYLSPGEIYYFRFRQKVGATTYPYIYTTEIIYS